MSTRTRVLIGLPLVATALVVAVLVEGAGWELPLVAVLVIPGAYLLVSPSVPFLQRPPAGVSAQPVRLAPVVHGRWTAINSPTTRVPSHGTHQYAQTYAVDLLVEGDLERPGGPFGRPEDLASFAVPVLSAVEGTVVTAVDGQRDHRNRRGLLGFAYFLPESVVRSLLGARRILGNHVVVRAATPAPGGSEPPHVLVCHLKRGSLAVGPGDPVRVGQELGRCGNSGNSTQPHVHLQAMTGPDPRRATGLPFQVLSGVGAVDLPATGAATEL